MAPETYRCPLCSEEVPPYELAGSRAESVFVFPAIGPAETVVLQLADGTKHEHYAERSN